MAELVTRSCEEGKVTELVQIVFYLLYRHTEELDTLPTRTHGRLNLVCKLSGIVIDCRGANCIDVEFIIWQVGHSYTHGPHEDGVVIEILGALNDNVDNSHPFQVLFVTI